MTKFMDLYRQIESIENQILDDIKDCIRSSSFIGGEEIRFFELTFAELISVEHCVGVGNGTDALEIAIESLGLTPGGEVIIPSNSFYASAESVIRQGLKPVFADFDPNTLLLNADSVKTCITSQTVAVMPVHLYGNVVDVEGIKEILPASVKIIEDCAQAQGASIRGKFAGSLGDIAAWSFYPGKNLGAFGDAGAITTNNSDYATKCRKISNHGRLTKYDHEIIGRNSRLDTIQAIVLKHKLNLLASFNSQRNKNAQVYYKQLGSIERLVLPRVLDEVYSVFHHFVVRTELRDELQKFLQENDVSTGIHYPRLLPNYPALEKYSWNRIYKNTDQVLSLPVAEHLNTQQVENICALIKRFFNDKYTKR